MPDLCPYCHAKKGSSYPDPIHVLTRPSPIRLRDERHSRYSSWHASDVLAEASVCGGLPVNSNVYSAECLHRMHSSCEYEDCACKCHIPDDELSGEDMRYMLGSCPECDALVGQGESHDSECSYA
jgi:hypothetical protein